MSVKVLQATSASVDQSNANVDQINASVDQINANVDQINANVDQINANVDPINVSVDQTNAEAPNLPAAVVLLQRVLRPIPEELLASVVWNVRELAVCMK